MGRAAQEAVADWAAPEHASEGLMPERALRARRSIVIAVSAVLVFLGTVSILCFLAPHRPFTHLVIAAGASFAALLIALVERNRCTSEVGTQSSLLASQARQRLLLRALENADDCIAVTDLQDRIVYANRSLLEAFEYSEADVLGQHTTVLRNFLPDSAFGEKIHNACLQQGWSGEFWTLSKSGKRFLLSLRTSAVLNGRGEVVGAVGVARDITAKKQVEEELRRTNRALRTLVECHQKMAEAKSETELLHEVCRVLVNAGDYRIAWIGSIDHDATTTVTPLVAAGCSHARLNCSHVSWGSAEAAASPIAAAVRTGKPSLGRDLSLLPQCDIQASCCDLSCIVLPLREGERVFAVLVLLSQGPGTADEEEIRLLKELADQVAFGVHAMRAEAARLRAVADLAASETRFRTLIEDAPVAISIGRNEERLYVNGAFMRLFGIEKPEEVIGRPISERWAVQSRAEVDKYFQERARGVSSSASLESAALRQDGSEFVAHVDVAEILLPDGPATMSFFSDVSDRKRAEAALRKAEEEYRTIFEQAVEGIYRTSPEGKSLAANPAFAKILGYDSPSELIGSITDASCQIWADPEDRARFVRELEKSGAVCDFESRCVRKDGGEIWISVNGHAVRDASGKTLYYEGFIEDISRRKQLEAQFLHSQKMEAVGRLAGGVAHDFNNLLGVITGYAELINTDPSAATQTKQRLEQIEKAAQQAIQVTRQLLAFSRKQVLQPKPLALNEMIRAAMKMLGRILGEDIEIVAALQPDLAAVHADPTSIDQVVLNLAINARDAMPDGGTLSIETANLDLESGSGSADSLPGGQYVMLAVSDTGTGMNAETQKHIFEPFFTTKGLGRGTGLGLSTVYGIVKQSGAHIRVESEVGSGTTFRIYFPKDSAAAQAAEAAHGERLSAGSETILLVEDDAQLLRLNSELLSSLGYLVLEAGNANEALAASEGFGGHIDLLMTDVVMPGLNGKELSDRLVPVRPNMRVLYVSGYSQNILESKHLPSGSAFLQKPFSRNTLAKKLRELLDGTNSSAAAA